MKRILFVWILFWGAAASATEITPDNLIGTYRFSARALLQQFYGNIYVHSPSSFEFERTYPDGRREARCQGAYTLMVAPHARVLQGSATCPDDRQKKLDFRIDFGNKTMEDLIRGTTVQVRSSLTGGLTVNANVKKQ